MDKNSLELFKQAISEGLSNKFDSIANSHTDEIVCSEEHNVAMRTIVYGKSGKRKVWSPRTKRIIAILVATALLLTSCGIIFRNEIREIFEDFFVKLTYKSDDTNGNEIEEIYELSYLPDGYILEEENITPLEVHYKFSNKNNSTIWYDQRVLYGTDFVVDSESGYTLIKDIQDCEIYYRFTNKNHYYLWNDGKYSMKIKSSIELSNEEIVLILKGIKIK